MTNGEKTASPSQEDCIKLLLIDDEAGYADVLANRLEKRRISVTKAYSGSAAMHAVRDQDFDVAILDLKMEDMDGLEVLTKFKEMGLQTEVIMLTGYGSQTAARDGIRLGAFDYLSKTCELVDLIETIKQACQKKKQAQLGFGEG